MRSLWIDPNQGPKSMETETQENVTVTELEAFMARIDWDDFNRQVIEENTKNAEAYERARAKSLESAGQYVLV